MLFSFIFLKFNNMTYVGICKATNNGIVCNVCTPRWEFNPLLQLQRPLRHAASTYMHTYAACGRTGPMAPPNPTGNPNFNLKKRPDRYIFAFDISSFGIYSFDISIYSIFLCSIYLCLIYRFSIYLCSANVRSTYLCSIYHHGATYAYLHTCITFKFGSMQM
jgi:hypothetical protein